MSKKRRKKSKSLEDKVQKSGFSKLAKPIAGLAIATAAGLVVYSGIEKEPVQTEQTQERITFEQARENPSLREAYVEQFDYLTEEYPFVNSINYSNELPSSGDHTLMNVVEYRTQDLLRIRRERLPLNIVVNASAFDLDALQTEDDFLNLLIDHEIEGHARFFHEGFPNYQIEENINSNGNLNALTAPDLRIYATNTVFELFAYTSQKEGELDRNVSSNICENTIAAHYLHYSALMRPEMEHCFRDISVLEGLRERFFLPEYLTGTPGIPEIPAQVIVGDQFIGHYGTVQLSPHMQEIVRSWEDN